jgi:hypothetical protein
MRCRFFILLGVGLVSACADSSLTEANEEFLSLSIVGGNLQDGHINEELPKPLVVQVTEGKNDRPVQGFVVNFIPVEGGGRVWAGAGITDKLGYASDYWILGPEPGPNRLVVRSVTGLAGTKDTWGEFTATASLPPMPPEVGSVTFSTSPSFETDQICTASGFTDPNGDELTYSWEWYNGGSLVKTETGTNPSSILTTAEGSYFPSDFLECRAQVSDGTFTLDWIGAGSMIVSARPGFLWANFTYDPSGPGYYVCQSEAYDGDESDLATLDQYFRIEGAGAYFDEFQESVGPNAEFRIEDPGYPSGATIRCTIEVWDRWGESAISSMDIPAPTPQLSGRE